MQIQGISAALGLPSIATAVKQPTSAGESFGKLLSQAISDINDSQMKADDLKVQMATGGNVEIHDVMIAGEEANLSMQLALQVRNKVLESYQEIMRMSV